MYIFISIGKSHAACRLHGAESSAISQVNFCYLPLRINPKLCACLTQIIIMLLPSAIKLAFLMLAIHIHTEVGTSRILPEPSCIHSQLQVFFPKNPNP